MPAARHDRVLDDPADSGPYARRLDGQRPMHLEPVGQQVDGGRVHHAVGRTARCDHHRLPSGRGQVLDELQGALHADPAERWK